MPHRLLIAVVLALVAAPVWAEADWQVGRIVDVQKDVKTDTLYWVASTPVTAQEVTYRVVVHLKDKLFTGVYKIDRSQPPLPQEWARNQPIKTRVEGSNMYLQAKSGDEFKIAIARRKSVAMLQPVPSSEVDEAYGIVSKVKRDSPIGFATPKGESEVTGSADNGAATRNAPGETAGEQAGTDPAAAAPATAAPSATDSAAEPEQEATGTLSVTTAPYLADVYVDGKNIGYSPTKITLPPGKHTVRLEKQGYKSWSKEVEIAANAELTVDATLENDPGQKGKIRR
jgi:hypothetical protein